MALKLKTRKGNTSALERAARSRSKDFENEELSRQQEDLRVNTFLNRADYNLQPGLFVNQPMSSNRHREFLRDTRFFIHLNNEELAELERETDGFLRRSLNTIHRIQKDTDALDASILEEEIRFYKNYDQVHFNGFIREKDMPLNQNDNKWMVDFKTESSFERHQLLNVFQSTGVTLPIGDKLRVPIVNAHILHEETDVGDTREPIISSDPRNVFLPDKVFRWVIIKREHDDTTRKYKRDTSKVALLLDLPGIQLINLIQLVPASSSSLLVDSLTYINEANEEVSLSSLELDSRGGLTFLFEPIRARKLKVVLVQHAPVVKLARNHLDIEVQELNKLLEGLDWVSRFDMPEEYIEGRVFDFSVRDIQIGLNTYLSTGIYRSKDVHVSNIASALVTDAIELIPVTNTADYTRRDSLPEAEAFSEYYLGLDIQNNQGKRLIKDLIPIPDSYPIQTEFLPLVGTDGRLKLMPDLTWNLNTIRVLTATASSSRRLDIVTESIHYFQEGDFVSFIASSDSPLTGRYEVKSVNGTFGFSIQTTGPAVDAEVTQNTTPYLKVYKEDAELTNRISPPIRVFKDGVELFINTDYQLNFGSTNNFLSSFPTGKQLAKALEDPRSGKAYIRILNPSLTSIYWVEYKPLANQWLGKTKLVKLKNGKVVFSSKFRNCKGTINTVLVLRGDFANPYSSPLLRNYSLKLREF